MMDKIRCIAPNPLQCERVAYRPGIVLDVSKEPSVFEQEVTEEAESMQFSVLSVTSCSIFG
jgi:hypothetical protein